MFLRSILPFVQAPHDEYKRNMAYCRVDFNFIFHVEETIASKMDVFFLSIFHEHGGVTNGKSGRFVFFRPQESCDGRRSPARCKLDPNERKTWGVLGQKRIYGHSSNRFAS